MLSNNSLLNIQMQFQSKSSYLWDGNTTFLQIRKYYYLVYIANIRLFCSDKSTYCDSTFISEMETESSEFKSFA